MDISSSLESLRDIYYECLEQNHLEKDQRKLLEESLDFKASRQKSRLEKDRERKRKKLLEESPDSKALRQKKDRDRKKNKRINESPVSKASRQSKNREAHSIRRHQASPNIKAAEQKQDQERKLKQRQSESQVSRESRQAKDREAHFQRSLQASPNLKASQLKKNREAHNVRNREASPSSKSTRREKNRQAQEKRRRDESPISTAIRQEKDREHHKFLKTNVVIDNFEEFRRKINVFANIICDICTKRCYPNQAVNFKIDSKNPPGYLPQEILDKVSLTLCHRCNTHVHSKTKNSPSKAFWNNLDPGVIPEEIMILSKSEVRLLARIIPFTKIIKYTGSFGQYGFQGQSILFGQDIFEITEKLPTMLPRSRESTGLYVITEELENLNITREYTVSKDKMNAALDWLIANNPLYKDVTNVTNQCNITEADFVSVMMPEENNKEKPCKTKSWKEISKVSRIIRGNYHQGDQLIFNSLYAGVQSTTMALANLTYLILQSAASWDANIINSNMIEGDSLNSTIRKLSIEKGIDLPKGNLKIQDFEIIKEEFSMFNFDYKLNYNTSSKIFGNLKDDLNKVKSSSVRLEVGLEALFEKHSSGIITSNSETYAIFQNEGKFYFADTHSCGPKGAPGKKGSACVIQCDNTKELCRVIKRATSSKNREFIIYYVEVVLKNNEELQQRKENENIEAEKSDEGLICENENENIEAEKAAEGLVCENELDFNNKADESGTWKSISPISRIIHASFHQADEKICESKFVHCLTIALVNLARLALRPAVLWNTDIINDNLIQGSYLYSVINNLSSEKSIALPKDGFLRVRDFRDIKQGFRMFERDFELEYGNFPNLCGNLKDKLNNVDGRGVKLEFALEYFFERHSTGILICNTLSYSIFKEEGKLYFVDPHGCGLKGAPAKSKNGKACIIQCDTVQELNRIIKRATSFKDIEYTLDYINVVVKSTQNPNVLSHSISPKISKTTKQISQKSSEELVCDKQLEILGEKKSNTVMESTSSETTSTKSTISKFSKTDDLLDHEANFVKEDSKNVRVDNSSWKSISAHSLIIYGSYNQGDRRIFKSKFVGTQCATMALSNLVKLSFQPAASWDTDVINNNMIEADTLHSFIHNLSRKNGIVLPADGYLLVRNFDVIKEDFIMFGKHFKLEYALDPKIYGCLDDDVNNNEGPGVKLEIGLQNLFEKNSTGILICESKCYAVFRDGNYFYFADSHACGEDGVSCVIQTDEIKVLTNIIKRTTSSRKAQYTLDYVNVSLKCTQDPNTEKNTISNKIIQASQKNSKQILCEDSFHIVNVVKPDAFMESKSLESLSTQNSTSDNNITSKCSKTDPSVQGANYVKEDSKKVMDDNRSCSKADDLLVQETNSVKHGSKNARIDNSSWKSISSKSLIIHGSFHQGDMRIFKSEFVGTQCATMALSNLVKLTFQPAASWDTDVINNNMIEADTLHSSIHNLSRENGIVLPADGYLLVRNFDVIKTDFIMFGKHFQLEYASDPQCYGCLDDDVNNNEGPGVKLEIGLLNLFEKNSTGILICESKCYAVFKDEKNFYFADSHACGEDGVTSSNGVSCVIQSNEVPELSNLIKRTTSSSRENQYTLDYVKVTLKRTKKLIDNSKPIHKKAHHEISKNKQIDNIPVQTSVMMDIDCRQPREEVVLQDVPGEGESIQVNKVKRKTKDNIVKDSHELKAEEFAWYQLFPYGTNGLKEKRPVKITPLDYFQYRIMGRDLRFQSNDYLFYATSMFEYHRIRENINVCGKKIQLNNAMVEDLHLYIKSLRGSAAYWQKCYNELIAQIRCLGPPQYFLTLSCNDLHWTDMRRALMIADNITDRNPEDLTIREVQALIEKYPVVLSRQFMIRVNAIMHLLKTDPSIFNGVVNDFWWRIEFQNRGSPHLHLLLWIPNTPAFDSPEGIAMIDRNISCELPENDAKLRALVEKLQVHHHTSTCYKNNRERCRFSFPRRPSDKTRILSHASDEFIRNGGRSCVLKRREHEQFINNYNGPVIITWDGNIDASICEGNETIARYLAKYCSKSEPTDMSSTLRTTIKNIQREEGDPSKKLFKICMQILNQRQVSAAECAFRLCHLPLKASSRVCVFINTRLPEQRYKVLQFNKDKATGFCKNIMERYIKRPYNHAAFNFEEMPLIEFAMLFEPHYKKKNSEDEEDDLNEMEFTELAEPLDNKLIKLIDNEKMKIRKMSAIVRVPYFNESKDPNNYYYSLLQQYKPYRDEKELLDGFDSPKSAFLANEEALKTKSRYLEKHRAQDKQLENAFNLAHAFQGIENALDSNEDPNYELIEESDHRMTDNEFSSKKQAMNVDQTTLFNYITSQIRNQINGSTDRIRMFITGGAGTGKTFTLNLLKEQICRCYGGETTAVKVAALTGAAARLVQGRTLHSLLKLKVQKDGVLEQISMLSGEYLRQMRLQWKNTKFFIVDEVSMIPYEILVMIDSRLKQLFDNLDIYGGVNILFFGDLMQLPPVRGNPVFKQPVWMEPATDLWQILSFCELTINMRQKGDTTFIDILNALRIGELKTCQLKTLLNKVADKSGEFAVGRALRIDPTIKLVDGHNNEALNYYETQGIEMVTIQAQDRISKPSKQNQNQTIENLIPKDINKTGGLPKTLRLFVGAKVMLRYNVNTEQGLVNGAIGDVVEIIWPLFRRAMLYEGDLPNVKINFESIGEHIIEPRTVEFPAMYSAGDAERRMLPLILCWATTVHKMQGSTVDHAVINLGPQVFAAGQAYVALSRVRSLDGFILEELDCRKVMGKQVCNTTALKEMDRLRKLPKYNE